MSDTPTSHEQTRDLEAERQAAWREPAEQRAATQAEIIEGREEEIQDGLREFYGRHVYEPATFETPLSALFLQEGRLGTEDFEELEIRRESIRAFIAYVAQDGIHPADMLRNFVAVCAHMGLEPFNQLTSRVKAKLLGGSHESHQVAMKVLCIRPLQRKGCRSLRAPGAKTREAQEVASRVQKGNCNRLGGKKLKAPPAAPVAPLNGHAPRAVRAGDLLADAAGAAGGRLRR